MKAAFYTLGCKSNQYDTEIIRGDFLRRGFEIGDFSERCDVYIINTCSVTAMSDRKSRQIISRARALSPGAVICVTGCYAQLSPEKVASIEGVDVVSGTADRHCVLPLVLQFMEQRRKVVSVRDVMKERTFESSLSEGFAGHTRANIKIEDGCDRFCTYCIIPYARGPVRSKDIDELIREARGLVANGYKELVLTGIHLASYGKDTGRSLIEALELLDGIDGDFRLRLGSLEPTLIEPAFIGRAARLRHLCPHFHIALQSGCDRTLKSMGRRYTTDIFAGACAAVRAGFPGAAITTDVIVGFPGESDADFAASRSFVRDIGFLRVHVFPYSRRPGTKAADMDGQLPSEIKQERVRLMIQAANEGRARFLSAVLGSEQQVLFEEVRDGYAEGLTPSYITVRVTGGEELRGTVRTVRLIGDKGDHVAGELI